MKWFDIVVVGGGAAGMMAAICAARQGAAVTLIERNQKVGRKLYITGKGRQRFHRPYHAALLCGAQGADSGGNRGDGI